VKGEGVEIKAEEEVARALQKRFRKRPPSHSEQK